MAGLTTRVLSVAKVAKPRAEPLRPAPHPKVETTVPTGDSATAFLLGAGVLGAVAAYQGFTTTNAPGANQLFLRKYTPTADCTLNSVALVPGPPAGRRSLIPARMVLDSSPDTPIR